jgi:peptidoglycan hydrolase-like protein with peptidoglycan-binding domain
LAGSAVGWAATTVLLPPKNILDSTDHVYVDVTTGEVGSSLKLNTLVEWSPLPAGANLATGTVTTVDVEPGQKVTPGTKLYTVDLRPVVIAEGTIPAFGAIDSNSANSLVKQLQAMLKSIGLYDGPTDGEWGRHTTAALHAWQEQLGLVQDGVVQPGDIIFVPTLPARVALNAELIKRGKFLLGGEEIVSSLPDSPTFTIPVTFTQAGIISVGTRVEVTGPAKQEWEGFVLETTVSKTGEPGVVDVVLSGKAGAAICGNECGTIPLTGQAPLESRIVTVETESGLVVPTAALLTTADGSSVVIDDKGASLSVTLITSARGETIIEGIPAETRVRVPAVGK